MPRNKKPRRYTSRYVEESNPTKKLFSLIVAIIFLSSLLILTFTTFAPKIGALFGFLSIYRNQQEAEVEAAIPTPIFVDTSESTNSTRINIKGISEPTTSVELFVNGPKYSSVLADAVGEFIFTDVKLIKGTNTIFAKAVRNDQESEKSNILRITVDEDKPEINIKDPKDGETIRNLNGRISIEGELSEDAVLKINDRTAVLNPDLTFDYILGVDEGNVEITVEATDPAGNTTVETLNVRYEQKSG